MAKATSYPHEIALARVVKNRVEAAYRRGELLDKRRGLMVDWPVFCGGTGPAGRAGANDAAKSEAAG